MESKAGGAVGRPGAGVFRSHDGYIIAKKYMSLQSLGAGAFCAYLN
jgi:hypothetical protein